MQYTIHSNSLTKNIENMKKLLFTALLAFWSFLASYGQFNVKMGAGASFWRSGILEAGIGYNWHFLNIGGMVTAHTSSKVTNGVLFQAKIGHEIPIGSNFTVNPQIGYAYNYRSSDFKGMNSGHPLLGIELFKMLREDIGIYGGYVNSGNLSILTAGIRGTF